MLYRGHQMIQPRTQHLFRFEGTVTGIRELAEQVMQLDHNSEAIVNLKNSNIDLIGESRLWTIYFFKKNLKKLKIKKN